MEPVLNLSTVAPATSTTAGAAGLSATERSRLIAGMARMLDCLHRLATGVLANVTVAEAHLVFVAEQPVLIDPLPDPAGRPRGREHPLVTLVKLALSSARLLTRLLKLDSSTDAAADLHSLEGFVAGLRGMAAGLGLDPDAA